MERIIISLFLALLVSVGSVSGQNKAYAKKLTKHRKKVEKEFTKPETSPLRDLAKDFAGNEYFDINEDFVVSATLELTPDSEPFELITSDPAKKKLYVRYAILHFTVNGQEETLEVYRSVALQGITKYKDHLFLPFTDLTTGEITYGGGRYLDLEVPDGDTIEIDFNLAYNPYCAYRSDGWSCPIPPDANRMDVAIEAGVKDYHGADH